MILRKFLISEIWASTIIINLILIKEKVYNPFSPSYPNPNRLPRAILYKIMYQKTARTWKFTPNIVYIYSPTLDPKHGKYDPFRAYDKDLTSYSNENW